MDSILFLGAESVFPENDIQRPMQIIFYMPVSACNDRKQFRNWLDAAQEVSFFYNDLVRSISGY